MEICGAKQQYLTTELDVDPPHEDSITQYDFHLDSIGTRLYKDSASPLEASIHAPLSAPAHGSPLGAPDSRGVAERWLSARATH